MALYNHHSTIVEGMATHAMQAFLASLIMLRLHLCQAKAYHVSPCCIAGRIWGSPTLYVLHT